MTHTTQHKPTKLNKLANALLAGKHLTGLVILNEYRISSYRDAILILRNRGMDIKTAMDKHADGLHGRYYMTQQGINDYLSQHKGVTDEV